jgi:hypothetical protein
MTANDFIGGFSLSVKEILDLSKEEPATKWYKLLDEKRAKEHNEIILADDEVKKVRSINIINRPLPTPRPLSWTIKLSNTGQVNLPPPRKLSRDILYLYSVWQLNSAFLCTCTLYLNPPQGQTLNGW